MRPDKKIKIRLEIESDYPAIRELVKKAFSSAAYTDGDEHNLIDRIRNSEEYIPELSLVAVSDEKPVGYIMFTRILIGGREAVALAPLAVDTEMQNIGIGKLLIEAGHTIARHLEFPCSVVLGDPGFYSKSGYLRASDYNITPPFDISDEYYMLCPFCDISLLPKGVVKYSDAFRL